ncbi:MAG TPA: hypothetical protein VMD92_10285 [Acidobacteriaceae bacterium]|nr:hypothetical protein [Acidobacteriaceae bacterium]
MECRFVYPNGQHCRLRATTTHVFCRQHAPQPRVPTLRNRATPFRRWLDLRRALPSLDRSEIPPAILFVLGTLLQDGPGSISDRNAGVLLRALLRRFGSVPFTLPGGPGPEPDSAFALSQSIDRLVAMIHRRRARLLTEDIDPSTPVPPTLRGLITTPSRTPAESAASPHSHPGGGGYPVD